MLLLPTGTAVTVDTIADVCQLIRLIVTSGTQIRSRLNTPVDAVAEPVKRERRPDRQARAAKGLTPVPLPPLRTEG